MSGKHETTRSVLRGFKRDNAVAAAFAGLSTHATASTKMLPLADVAALLIAAGADPDSPDDWHYEFVVALQRRFCEYNGLAAPVEA